MGFKSSFFCFAKVKATRYYVVATYFCLESGVELTLKISCLFLNVWRSLLIYCPKLLGNQILRTELLLCHNNLLIRFHHNTFANDHFSLSLLRQIYSIFKLRARLKPEAIQIQIKTILHHFSGAMFAHN